MSDRNYGIVYSENMAESAISADDDDDAPPEVSKTVQCIFTFSIIATAAYFMWPSLEPVSKGLVITFATLAGLAINSGTWLQNSRDLRRNQREQRREVFREANDYFMGSRGKTKRR